MPEPFLHPYTPEYLSQLWRQRAIPTPSPSELGLMSRYIMDSMRACINGVLVEPPEGCPKIPFWLKDHWHATIARWGTAPPPRILDTTLVPFGRFMEVYKGPGGRAWAHSLKSLESQARGQPGPFTYALEYLAPKAFKARCPPWIEGAFNYKFGFSALLLAALLIEDHRVANMTTYGLKIPPKDYYVPLIDETFEDPKEIELSMVQPLPMVYRTNLDAAHGDFSIRITPQQTEEDATGIAALNWHGPPAIFRYATLLARLDYKRWSNIRQITLQCTSWQQRKTLSFGFSVNTAIIPGYTPGLLVAGGYQHWFPILNLFPQPWKVYRIDIDLMLGMYKRLFFHNIDFLKTPLWAPRGPASDTTGTTIHLQVATKPNCSATVCLDDLLLINYGPPLYPRDWQHQIDIPNLPTPPRT
jgi:hypothetical protein